MTTIQNLDVELDPSHNHRRGPFPNFFLRCEIGGRSFGYTDKLPDFEKETVDAAVACACDALQRWFSFITAKDGP